MIVYHGTTKSNLNRILKNGFENRDIMFANKKEEAIKYAYCYCYKTNDSPVLIIVDISRLEILSNKDYKIKFDGNYHQAKLSKIDGIHSDTFERNNLSDYFVIFNINKLNLINFSFEELK